MLFIDLFDEKHFQSVADRNTSQNKGL
jgi:hypothetical protein